jgi:regulator of sirC expression with transglutaminase-like and TPR domain
MAFIGTDDLDAAEQSLKQAYTLGGPIDGRAAHLYLAAIYDKRKQYQKAVNELETYLRDNPKAANASKIQEAIQKLKAKQ